MLTAYFDESGTDGHSPIVAVGGYVSTKELWEAFEVEWKQLLVDEEIVTFHTTDIVNQKKEFTVKKGWDTQRVTHVLNKADAIIEKYALFGAVSYTEINECEKIFPLRIPREKYSAEYFISGVQVVWGINEWALQNEYTEPIQYFFEDGANGKGYLREAISYARQDINHRHNGLVGDIIFDCKERHPQFNAADKLIQQSRRAIVRFNDEKETDIIIQRLIKARLGKVFRFDSENLPLLREIADAGLLKSESE